MIAEVKIIRTLAFAIVVTLSACQAPAYINVTIIDGAQVRVLAVHKSAVPASLIQQAGLTLAAADQVLVRGYPVDAQVPLPIAGPLTLQIQRSTRLMVNGKPVQTLARTVGEALAQTGLTLYARDQIAPPADALITDGMAVSYVPSQAFTITVDGRATAARSATNSVGGVLADSGLSLTGLDFSRPAEDQPPPEDGRIQVVRVAEDITLAEKPIPYESQFQSSADVELDHQQVLQAGQPGLVVTRTRVRFEDGQEVSRQIEPEAVVRAPRDRVVGYGTKVVVHTVVVDGVQIQYWRAVQMFTTAYSPCNSGADRCYSGTSSGKPVEKGVVAVRYSWYLAMQGQAIYVPGYGRASIEDVCGGCVGKPWIDLGYTDAQYAQEGGQWGKYVTVYFLAPPPQNILYVLQ